RRQRLARLAEAETAEPEGAQTEADDDQDDDDTGSGGLRRQGPDSGDSGGGAQAPSGDVEAPEGAVRDTAREFVFGGPDRRRSGDLSIFSRTLYQLSYRTLEAKTRPGGPGFFCSATPTGLEPAASAVTGRRSNQLSYGANLTVIKIGRASGRERGEGHDRAC